MQPYELCQACGGRCYGESITTHHCDPAVVVQLMDSLAVDRRQQPGITRRRHNMEGGRIMPEYTVRVRREMVSYAEVIIAADDLQTALDEIEAIEGVITEEESEYLGDGSPDWEDTQVDLKIEEITDEAGNEYNDVEELREALEDAEPESEAV